MEEQIDEEQKTHGIIAVYYDNTISVQLLGSSVTWLQVDKPDEKTAELIVNENGTIFFSPPCDENSISFPKELTAKKTLRLEEYLGNTNQPQPGVYYFKEQSDSL